MLLSTSAREPASSRWTWRPGAPRSSPWTSRRSCSTTLRDKIDARRCRQRRGRRGRLPDLRASDCACRRRLLPLRAAPPARLLEGRRTGARSAPRSRARRQSCGSGTWCTTSTPARRRLPHGGVVLDRRRLTASEGEWSRAELRGARPRRALDLHLDFRGPGARGGLRLGARRLRRNQMLAKYVFRGPSGGRHEKLTCVAARRAVGGTTCRFRVARLDGRNRPR